MATGPLYKINDIVYLVESAVLGELEAYKIGAIQQATPGRWIYQIFIDKRPPDTQTAEDRVDLKLTRQMFYDESELTTLCLAVNMALTNMERRINRSMLYYDAVCGGTFTPPPPKKGDSKFDIGDTAFIKASAERGFIETYQITNIHKQPSVSEFLYELNIHGTTVILSNALVLDKFRQMFFRESELIDQCEALNIALSALDRKVARLLAIKGALCPSPEPGSGTGSV